MRYAPLAQLARVLEQEVWLARLRGADGFDRPVALLRAIGASAEEETLATSRLATVEHPHVLGVIELVRADGALVLAVELPIALSVGAIVRVIEESGGRVPWAHATRLAADLARGAAAMRRGIGTRGGRGPGLVDSSLLGEHGFARITSTHGSESDDLRSLGTWLEARVARDGVDAPSALRDTIARARAEATQRRITLASFADSLDAIASSRAATHGELARFLAAEVGEHFARTRASRDGAVTTLPPPTAVESLAQAFDRLAGLTDDETATQPVGEATVVDAQRARE